MQLSFIGDNHLWGILLDGVGIQYQIARVLSLVVLLVLILIINILFGVSMRERERECVCVLHRNERTLAFIKIFMR